MIIIEFVKIEGIWRYYKINGIEIAFNYQPSEDEIIRAYDSYCNGNGD